MARYMARIDIWKLNDSQRSKLQPGQYIVAGEDGPTGRFWGQGRTTVAAWDGNARRNYAAYQKAMRDYAKSQKGK